MEDKKYLIGNHKKLNTLADRLTINSPMICDQSKVLCRHCGRTAENSIKCSGRCVADNEY